MTIMTLGAGWGRRQACLGYGWLDFAPNNQVNTNTLYLTDPKFSLYASYIKVAEVYHCPADKSTALEGGKKYPRTRSMSMSQAFNCQGSWLPAPKYKVFRKMSDVTDPGPSRTYCLLDEHPDGINAGGFANMMVKCRQKGIIDYPASYHMERRALLSWTATRNS